MEGLIPLQMLNKMRDSLVERELSGSHRVHVIEEPVAKRKLARDLARLATVDAER